MPELPEVEAVARSLRPLVRDQRIRRAYVFHPIATRPQAPADLIALSEERRLKTISRCGKYLFLELDRGLIELHFRLDGQLTWFSSTKELFERANRKPMGVHVDVAFEFGWGVLGFSDGRHFGRVHAWESADACLPLANLGVDAMSRKFTSRRLRTMLAASKRPVKEFLLARRVSPALATSIRAKPCGTRDWIRGVLRIPFMKENRRNSIKRLCRFFAVL